MTTASSPYPVDSTFHACCNGIGKHAPHCEAHPFPEVAPPPGAWFVDDWGSAGDDCRVILGVARAAVDSDIKVNTCCIQHADGHIDDGSTNEYPHVYLSLGKRGNLNSDQARELAALLLEMAAEIDGWASR
jgi:hypothetical protein